MPTVNKDDCPCFIAVKREKSTSAFVLEDHDISYSCLYRFISPHEISAPAYQYFCSFKYFSEKVSIYNDFYVLIPLNNSKVNTIFYPFVSAAGQPSAGRPAGF